MNMFLLAGVLGGVGGIARSAVGLTKAIAAKRKIVWDYWLVTAGIAVVIGIFTGTLFNFDMRLSLLAGYAGTDIIEGIYKSFKVQKIIVMPSQK